ncbi:MAG TPA: ThuA domain-containing protein [Vicinamibacterales bacterium]|nr:ThuA domain-containing protein [Vicinamibacterales bacterium]
MLVLAVACGGGREDTPPDGLGPFVPQPTPSVPPLRVLMLTATTGFRHGSIETARQTLTSLGSRTGEFTITATEDVSQITAARLANVDVLAFILTTGELPFDAGQKAAIVSFVENGGGFIGAHSATDTLYEWADYGRLVGAYFNGHPWSQEATVNVEDRDHPATRAFGATFRLNEEYYTFRENPRSRVHVLLSLDAASVGTTGDYPLAWSHSFGSGRAFYTALGHHDATWQDTRFQTHMRGAINWVGKR